MPIAFNRRRLLGAALLSRVTCALAQATADDLVGGVWTARPSRGNFGESLAFHRNGSVSHGFGDILDMTYTVQGNTLVALATGPDGATQRIDFTYELAGDQLALRGPGEVKALALRRACEAGTNAADGLVGAWDFDSPFGTPGRFRFSADGRGQMLIDVKHDSGRYVLHDGQLTITLTGTTQPQVLAVTLQDGLLTLQAEAAQGQAVARRFTRFKVR